MSEANGFQGHIARRKPVLVFQFPAVLPFHDRSPVFLKSDGKPYVAGINRMPGPPYVRHEYELRFFAFTLNLEDVGALSSERDVLVRTYAGRIVFDPGAVDVRS